jgi:glycosyltransferase involved in cell wall biosynthesis
MPRVSVVIPAFNTASYIVQAVQSVLTQTYKDFEIIVVDDGSSDNTRDVMAPYQDRVRYVWQENQERAAARNHGLELAQGELIAFLDSDDVWMPDKLSRQVASLDEHADAVLATVVARNIGPDGQPLKFWGAAYTAGVPAGQVQALHHGSEILFGSSLIPSAVLVRRGALDGVGPFDTRAVPNEDWDMWIRLSGRGPFVHLPEVLCHYRSHGTPQELRRRTSDRVVDSIAYVIEKSSAADPERFPAALRDKALANMYAYSALASYEVSDVTRGHSLLERAVRLNPELGRRERITWLLEDHARRILRDTDDESRAVVFLTTVLGYLPAEIQPPRRGARGVLGRIYIGDTFRALSKDDRNAAQETLWLGVRHDPTWLLNWGVWSMIARAFVSRLETIEAQKNSHAPS